MNDERRRLRQLIQLYSGRRHAPTALMAPGDRPLSASVPRHCSASKCQERRAGIEGKTLFDVVELANFTIHANMISA